MRGGFFMTTIVVTANLIEQEGKILLVQEAAGPARGKWNFPAGKLEDRLTLQDNAFKEAKEESGYDVNVESLVGIYQDIGQDNVILFVFTSKITGGRQRQWADNEILQTGWFTFDEIKKMDLRGWYIVRAIEDHKRGSRTKIEFGRKE
jgi:ADP-ribose pyrophosphatase YjhB (NUDIX family)